MTAVSAASTAEPNELARVYLGHALAGRDADAVQTLIDPLIAGAIDLVSLFERVITPAAYRVGDLWYAQQISVADEHFVTQLNQKLIAIAGTLRPVPQSNSECVVLACPSDELHDTGLRMVAELLIAHGYAARTLGASTPIPALLDYVAEARPLAVGLSIASPMAISSLTATVNALREAQPGLPIFIGGNCPQRYPDVATAVGVPTCTTTEETLAYLAGLREPGTAPS